MDLPIRDKLSIYVSLKMSMIADVWSKAFSEHIGKQTKSFGCSVEILILVLKKVVFIQHCGS